MIGLMLKDIMPQKKVYLLVFMIAIIAFPVSSNYPLMPGLDMRFGPILVLFILGFLICFSGFMIDEREKADVIVNSFAIPQGCNKFCVNGYTTLRSEYGHIQGSSGRTAEGLQRA